MPKAKRGASSKGKAKAGAAAKARVGPDGIPSSSSADSEDHFSAWSEEEVWSALEILTFGTEEEIRGATVRGWPLIFHWKILRSYACVASWPALYDSWKIPESKRSPQAYVCANCKDWHLHCCCRHVMRTKNHVAPGSLKAFWKHAGVGRKPNAAKQTVADAKVV